MRLIIGIFCSLESEFWGIVKQYSGYQIVEQNKKICVCMANRDTLVAFIGVGNTNAYQNAVTILQKYEKVTCVISAGLAGALLKEVKLGEFIFGTSVFHYTLDKQLKKYIPFYKNSYIQYLRLHMKDSKFMEGSVISSEIFIQDRDEKEALHKNGGVCVEMEAAGVLKACRANRIPCIVVKIISDMAERGAIKSILKHENELTVRLGAMTALFCRFLQKDLSNN